MRLWLPFCLPKPVEVVSRIRYEAALWAPRPQRTGRFGRPRLHGRKLPRPVQRMARRPGDWKPILLQDGRRYKVQVWTALGGKVFRQRPIRIVASRRRGISEMLAALRRERLRGGVFHVSAYATQLRESLNALVESAAYAA